MQLQKVFTDVRVLLMVGVSAMFLGLSALWLGYYRAVPAEKGAPVVITVTKGMTAETIGALLYEKGLISNVTMFRIVARMEGLETSLQAGEYSISPGMTIREIVSLLAEGRTIRYSFTIPEGYTVDQIAKLLEEKKLANAEKFKALARDFAPYPYMVPTSPGVVYKAEGFIFPDTYSVSRGITEEELLKLMVSQFDRKFTPAMRQRAEAAGMSIRDVVTLASLVEREARLPKERPIIARVFLNRLQKEMPLQSCATIQYILGYPKPELTIKDTQIPSPYNTYLNQGLPPGPVANPGMAAIEAVLNPAQNDYLYFVVDGTGGHRFSRTYEEHLAAISKLEAEEHQ